jgi:hypothetical protein
MAEIQDRPLKPVGITKEMRIVAQDVIAKCVLQSLANESISWEDYPALGQFDWQRVVSFAEYNVEIHAPNEEKFDKAMAVLAKRAENEES